MTEKNWEYQQSCVIEADNETSKRALKRLEKELEDK